MNQEESKAIIPSERIERTIYLIRNHKVMLDEDLAVLYGIQTKVLNQAVSRNTSRFPADFAFRLSKTEWENLKSQFVTSRWGGRRKLPLAFTEQGVAMLSSVLRSPQAVAVNVEIMRAFVRLRQTLASHHQITRELTELKSFVLQHSNQTSREFQRVWGAIEKLSAPAPEKGQRKIGFDLGQ